MKLCIGHWNSAKYEPAIYVTENCDICQLTAELEAAREQIAEMNMMYEHPMNMLNGKNIQIARLRAALEDADRMIGEIVNSGVPYWGELQEVSKLIQDTIEGGE